MSKQFSDTSKKPTFQLKGTMLAITVFELAHFNIERLTKELTAKVQEAPEFFGTIPMVLSIDKLAIPLTRVELKGIVTLFKEFNIQLMALRTDDEKAIATAHKLGLVVLPPTGAREKLIEIAVNRPAPIIAETIPELTLAVVDDGQQQLIIEEISPAVVESAESAMGAVENDNLQRTIALAADTDEQVISEQPDLAEPSLAADKQDEVAALAETTKVKTPLQPTKIISTPVRSGQQVEAVDGDLIVTSTVSTGAELMADGNIHIYGTMRGRAMAGFHGNNKARVFCSKLTAELISIAGQMITEEELRRHPLWGKPAQLSLEENQLIISPLA